MKEKFTLYGVAIMVLGITIQFWNQIGLVLFLNGFTILLSISTFQLMRLVELKEKERNKKDE